ncbi:GGDEF domain-containing protein [Pseudoxanthomonas sp. SGD-10]|jgi:diguanylate cyclase (GGDEF) domain|nr:GGDEF domain-containing protein [Pseudoxanthomonas sp. J31]RRN80236.1 GGDEF domain-containing protein [Pseudoxanthomonas sp. SGD-10]
MVLALLAIAVVVANAFGRIQRWPPTAHLVTGQPTQEQPRTRDCPADAPVPPARAVVHPPPGGWPGVPQAVSVFNVFAGEVRLEYGGHRVCGLMHDARTRDSRFRAGVGMVIVPQAGNQDPVIVYWQPALKPGWIPTIRIGAPSEVQHVDTLRLVVRTACLAVALVLAATALMAYPGARDWTFLGYAALCGLSVVWQAVLSGLSGYPEPWLPVAGHEPRWFVGLSSMGLGAVLCGMWLLVAGPGLPPGVRRRMVLATAGTWIAASLTVLLAPLAWLEPLAVGVELAFRMVYLLILGWALHRLWRQRPGVLPALAGMLPFALIALLELAGSRLLIEYRVEVIQLAVTWFLAVSAYALNLRLGRLRRQRDEMQQLAETDPLTGLPNRRAGLRRLGEMFAVAREDGTALSVAFIDIDHFKAINDDHGHEAGDRVLVAVAQALRATVRGASEAARMGGEEFLMLLPGVAADSAVQRMHALRVRLAATARELGLEGLSLTASIGVATLRDGDADAAALLRRADQAMYAAKRGGRDQVQLAG